MIIFFLVYICLILVTSVAVFGLQAAFYQMIRVKDRNMRTQQGITYGMFFKKKYFKKLFLISLAHMGITLLATLLCVIPLFYVVVPLYYVVIIFSFHPEESINDIISAAFKLGNNKWFITFGLVFVSGIVATMVGFIACGIGVLFTASFQILPIYLIISGHLKPIDFQLFTI